MPDTQQVYAKFLDALEASEMLQRTMSGKIASQAAEIETLRSSIPEADTFRKVVAKLASAGVVDKCNAAYLDHNVNASNVGAFMNKLANVIETPAKKEAATSPYEVSTVSVTKATTDTSLDECNRRLNALSARYPR